MTDLDYSGGTVDPFLGAPDLAPSKPETILDRIRADSPDVGDVSDVALARTLYDAGQHKAGESFPAFASRVGAQQSPVETALNTGLSTAAFHLNEPVEAALSGVGSALTGGDFGTGYRQKRQEIDD